MGTIIAGLNEQIDRDTNEPKPTADTTSSGSASTTSTTTETRGSGSGGSGRAGGSGSGETKDEQLSGLALLTKEELEEYNNSDEENKKRLLRNAKRRERYAKQKTDGGQSVKPRKVRQTKKAEVKPNMDTKQLNAIVWGVSTVVASRPNCEHWLLTEKEIESITTPLAKMLEESKALETIGQYSNQIALTIACVSVFVPRLIITVQKQKEEKARAVTGQQTNTTVKHDKGRNSGEKKIDNKEVNRNNAGHVTNDGTNNGKNELFLGVPIC